MKKGTTVRMTTGQMGLMATPDDSRFLDEVLRFGDEATYLGPHPNGALADEGWNLLTVELDGRTVYCPAHDSHYEPADAPTLRGLLTDRT